MAAGEPQLLYIFYNFFFIIDTWLPTLGPDGAQYRENADAGEDETTVLLCSSSRFSMDYLGYLEVSLQLCQWFQIYLTCPVLSLY